MALSIPLPNETTTERDAHMTPSVSILTGESAEWDAFMRISSTDDIGDGTSVSYRQLSPQS